MPYVTQQQIEILDDLAARLGIADKDAWVQDHLFLNFDEGPSTQGVADLDDRTAAELILQWRKDLAKAQAGS